MIEALQKIGMNVYILAAEWRAKGVQSALGAIVVAFADHAAITAQITKISTVLVVAGVTNDPVKALASELQSL
jgi:hypothetical protein